MPSRPSCRSLALTAAAVSGFALGIPTVADAAPDHRGNGGFEVQQVNLVSDVPGAASLLDPDLTNAWGLAFNGASPLWVANNGSDTSTLYTSAPGTAVAAKVAAVRVTFPGTSPTQHVGPNGEVANGGTGFVLSNGTVSGPARFIFSTDSGEIRGWNAQVDGPMGAVETKATVPGASYTGLALASVATGDQLYAADFAKKSIDVFDSSFRPLPAGSAALRDCGVPADYAPFNVQNLGGHLFVSYAKVDRKTGDNAVGVGLGIVDEYTPEGTFVARIASHGSLNAPWGMAIAPATWGTLAGSLLVGNFGDGKINVIRPKASGGFEHRIDSVLRDSATKRVLRIDGLWALQPGTATVGGTDSIWFSAGPADEQHGLLGVLRMP